MFPASQDLGTPKLNYSTNLVLSTFMVSDSDDLKMTESEVGRLAFAIEKEMFNLCLSTDSKYKNKYRSLMFNLKDPKNKGLFYRVVGGEVSPFRLVRLSAEELVSKEISEWRKPDQKCGTFSFCLNLGNLSSALYGFISFAQVLVADSLIQPFCFFSFNERMT
uniref:TFIIS central domain-containing protein n=1 Tax=Amphilophus citrinellus TaxID=61819 RepID=A0A3Q0RSW3_AMPCI